MIYVTGDTHGTIDLRHVLDWPGQENLTKDDYLIILGDFGLVWNNSQAEKEARKQLSNCNFTTLFIDGNHENFELLNAYPITTKWGGQVQQIEDSIYHLRRGEIFDIDNTSFFVMGGASSIDRHLRTPGASWWPQEIPSYREFENGFRNLESRNWQVDYVLTHTCPEHILKIMSYKFHFTALVDSVNMYLHDIASKLTFKHWFFGHYHVDFDTWNYTGLYEKIAAVTDF